MSKQKSRHRLSPHPIGAVSVRFGRAGSPRECADTESCRRVAAYSAAGEGAPS
jgi:hypothetical protein